ncbi:MAG: 3-keto-5-aminohexanoate cleavage protein [Rhodospirillales bacterium]|nr:3-keto-5-aminohexanoate cleavage protein [Rhodospirillales bacterium]
MSNSVILTCAVTGNLTKPEQNPHLPITPEEIARDCLEAAEAGAAIVHIHVRDPRTGAPSMKIALYDEVVRLIRAQNDGLIINLTTGPGGRFQPSEEDPKIAGPRTNLLRPELRVEHIARIKPDIATLDLNTMTFGREVVINTPANVSKMAEIIYAAGVKPEIEIFDSGDLHLANDLIARGVLRRPAMFSFVLGVKYGMPAAPESMLFLRNMLPEGSVWAGFGVGRAAFPMLAQSMLLGGQIRIGMEDTVFVDKSRLASGNRVLVEKARAIVESLGGRLASTDDARECLGLGIAKSEKGQPNAAAGRSV